MSMSQFPELVIMLPCMVRETLQVCLRITRVLIRGSEPEDIRMGAEVKEENRCYTASFEDEGRDHKPKNAGSS